MKGTFMACFKVLSQYLCAWNRRKPQRTFG